MLRGLAQDPRLGQRVVDRGDVLAFKIISRYHATALADTLTLHRRDSLVLELGGDVHLGFVTVVLQFLLRDHLVSLAWVLLI